MRKSPPPPSSSLVLKPQTTLSPSQLHYTRRTTTLEFPSKPSKLIITSLSKSPNSPPNKNQPENLLLSIPHWADSIKEDGMQQRRFLYKHENWLEHRSSLRHVRHFLSSLQSRVILSLIPPVIVFTSFAAIIASYNSAVSFHWFPEYFPLLRASSLPYQLTAPALALLLVFRTEASYSRFEQGRKAWTKVIAGTSEFARQIMVSVVDDDALLKKSLLQYVVAFPVALKCHLVYGSDIGKDLRNLLEEDDLALVLSSKHRPRCIIEFISQNIQLLPLDDSKRTILESKISCFLEGIAVCEQLMGIPIPLSYTRLTSRFLVLWHLTLPVILWEDCNWIVVPATFISAASLFCIEEVGVLIEEPFPMLALDEICTQVRDSIQEAITIEKTIQGKLHAKQKCRANEQFVNGRPSGNKHE